MPFTNSKPKYIPHIPQEPSAKVQLDLAYGTLASDSAETKVSAWDRLVTEGIGKHHTARWERHMAGKDSHRRLLAENE
ncbi:hypothetical protein Ddc_17389 [Ditylenchus destructor]|nr:hypothetical protein Ddc_17389 [Ditylenchus destructor]